MVGKVTQHNMGFGPIYLSDKFFMRGEIMKIMFCKKKVQNFRVVFRIAMFFSLILFLSLFTFLKFGSAAPGIEAGVQKGTTASSERLTKQSENKGFILVAQAEEGGSLNDKAPEGGRATPFKRQKALSNEFPDPASPKVAEDTEHLDNGPEKIGIAIFTADTTSTRNKALYSYLGQTRGIKYILTPENPDDFFDDLAQITKDGKKIDFIIILGHGSLKKPHIIDVPI